ncbi:hypothetical protein J2X02_003001 [Pseudoxanthomonas japonensis]|uniref:hypothetical protein n=1 Tax=Pseudoxanthomonas japonensis TaxID=69284 RepID=UPI001A45086F|nr:hypothetical protein [Pseudoxanthomonas japonensis]MBA3928776.1 hypothetical protein [Xanthomonas sp.]MBL8256009.1 hypothetical protein [Pseudoxanthomonas mexicana]MDR7070150.1 hypothetical protein [Pseudoxanthomonas japonensis]
MRKLLRRNSTRRDLRVYLLLLVGGMFVYAGLTVDPASNCDASGRECAPWLVPVAFVMGMVMAGTALAMLVHVRRWGSRLDLEARTLWWWDDGIAPGEHAIALNRIARIRVQRPDESDDRVFLYDHDDAPLRFPSERGVPYDAVQWAKDLATHFPHIRVDVEGG